MKQNVASNVSSSTLWWYHLQCFACNFSRLLLFS